MASSVQLHSTALFSPALLPLVDSGTGFVTISFLSYTVRGGSSLLLGALAHFASENRLDLVIAIPFEEVVTPSRTRADKTGDSSLC